MAGLLGSLYSGIDSAKRVYGGLLKDFIDDPKEVARQQMVNRNNEAGRQLGLLDALYKDPQGKTTFDQSQWSPQAAGAHDEMTENAMGAVMGATGWQGSPYKFDKLDSRHIGKGEGNQSFGQGLYFAERDKIGRHYQRNVPIDNASRRLRQEFRDEGDADMAYRNFMLDPKVPKEQKRLLAALKKDDFLGFDNPGEAMQIVGERGAVNNFDLSQRTVNARNNVGHLYKVDIPDPLIGQMVDWDKPLYEQRGLMGKIESASNNPEAVPLRQTLDILGADPSIRTGESLMRAYPKKGADPGDAYGWAKEPRRAYDLALNLRDAGVPGVRYLDGLSRTPITQKSRAVAPANNYVVFPGMEKELTLLERNGVPLGGLLNY